MTTSSTSPSVTYITETGRTPVSSTGSSSPIAPDSSLLPSGTVSQGPSINRTVYGRTKGMAPSVSKSTKPVMINIIGGPGSGKSTVCSGLFYKLKQSGIPCEYLQEYAKKLVWTKKHHKLNNQYLVSKKMIDIMDAMMDSPLKYIITDGCILHGLYHNRHNRNNTSNIEKTEELIIKNFNRFTNINIFLERGDFKYEQIGRLEGESKSRQIDTILVHLMTEHGIDFKVMSNADEVFNYIKSLE